MIEINGVVAVGRVKHYERKGLYTPEDVLSQIGDEPVDFDGDLIRMDSLRYQLFNTNLVCVGCGLTAFYFAKERPLRQDRVSKLYWPTTQSYHFNLYGIDVTGREIMFTRDHRIPKASGGPDELANLQTMCAPCNARKKDRMPGETHEDYSRRKAYEERHRDLTHKVERARVYGKEAVDAARGLKTVP